VRVFLVRCNESGRGLRIKERLMSLMEKRGKESTR
jgi:hypothetical protein